MNDKIKKREEMIKSLIENESKGSEITLKVSLTEIYSLN